MPCELCELCELLFCVLHKPLNNKALMIALLPALNCGEAVRKSPFTNSNSQVQPACQNAMLQIAPNRTAYPPHLTAYAHNLTG